MRHKPIYLFIFVITAIILLAHQAMATDGYHSYIDWPNSQVRPHEPVDDCTITKFNLSVANQPYLIVVQFYLNTILDDGTIWTHGPITINRWQQSLNPVTIESDAYWQVNRPAGAWNPGPGWMSNVTVALYRQDTWEAPAYQCGEWHFDYLMDDYIALGSSYWEADIVTHDDDHFPAYICNPTTASTYALKLYQDMKYFDLMRSQFFDGNNATRTRFFGYSLSMKEKTSSLDERLTGVTFANETANEALSKSRYYILVSDGYGQTARSTLLNMDDDDALETAKASIWYQIYYHEMAVLHADLAFATQYLYQYEQEANQTEIDHWSQVVEYIQEEIEELEIQAYIPAKRPVDLSLLLEFFKLNIPNIMLWAGVASLTVSLYFGRPVLAAISAIEVIAIIIERLLSLGII